MAFTKELNQTLIEFINEQHVYFTGSAPLESDTRVNISPKGMDSFRVLNNNLVGYLDVTGSGNETAAHIYQNGRLTIMFCSFSDQMLILRLYGKGEVVKIGSDRWNDYSEKFPDLEGARQIILLHIDNVQTSCGFGLPVMDYKEDRTKLVDWAKSKGDDGVLTYQKKKNVKSIDGLPTHLFD